MNRILRSLSLFLFIVFVTGAASSQTIGTPTVSASGGPVSITFQVTNGNGSNNHFNGSTVYTVYLSNAAGTNFTAVYTFSSSSFPVSSNGSSANVTTTVPIPVGTSSGSGYKIAVGSTLPTFTGSTGANASASFTLFCAFSMPASMTGYIKSSSPAITYYLITITNTGNVTDTYTLSKTQSGTSLTSQFYSLTGSVITATPSIDPGEAYTFMVRFDTPNGTQPNNNNTTNVIATSTNCSNVTHTTVIGTYIYGGNGSSSIPNAPDMQIVKTAGTATATVTDYIDYTLTIKNISPQTASNPVIRDFIPSNVDIVSYAKSAGESRTVIFTYDATTRILNAVLQGSMTNASVPLTITVRVKTSCFSVPSVSNSAEVYTASGDNNATNDTASATTSVSYDLTSSNVGKWTGSYNTDWFDCRNWSGGVVPGNAVDVIINSSASNNVVIDPLSAYAPADKIARSYKITIAAGRTVTMQNQANLYVGGNWTNSGTFTPGNGTVSFTGAVSGVSQSVSDASNQLSLYNLTVNTTNGGKGLDITDGFALIISNNVNLISGDIRLNGKAQLVQTKTGVTANSTSGTGKLYRDQQGQSNKFSYNYWSSPVGSNNSYTVASVLYDGTTTSSPQPVNWTTGVDGSPTSPITLSSYWIYKYQNQTNAYANWTYLGQNGTLSAGQGFTLKGSGAATSTQNYTFVGKPNDGLLTSAVSSNNLNLSGNPYPSALDAYAFIDANITSTTGTLYFWEQYATNTSHYTTAYQGGYAVLTKTGSTPPVAVAGTSGLGSSTRIAGRYIPVGQGFFVKGSTLGGVIKFDNDQRAFVKENSALSNSMFRTGVTESEEAYKKIRLGFRSALPDSKRQILLGFMDGNATTGYDCGYDGVQIDTQDDDAYFPVGDAKLAIQGVGYFTSDAVIPVGVKVVTAGQVTFSLDATENFADSEAIFLFDSLTNVYYNIKNQDVSVNLQAGIYNDRFSLRFSEGLLSVSGQIVSETIGAVLANGNLLISNPSADDIRQVSCYNLAGQKVAVWNTSAMNQTEISLPMASFSTGSYIIKIECASKTVTRKLMKG